MIIEIIKANPDIDIEPALDSGIKLKIPVIEDTENITFDTAPWKE